MTTFTTSAPLRGAVSPVRLSLPVYEAHVWCVSLAQPRTVTQALSRTLSSDERRRASRFRFQEHAERFCTGRGLLRQILGVYLGEAPQDVEITYGPHGKPALAPAHRSDLRFNVSHSQTLALYAVTRSRDVGIDVERVRQLAGMEDIMKQVFSPREQATLAALSGTARIEAFFAFWTRKEAYLKAKGDGLTVPPSTVEVPLRPDEPPQLPGCTAMAQGAKRWSVRRLSPAPGYIAALAAEGDGLTIVARQWETATITAATAATATQPLARHTN